MYCKAFKNLLVGCSCRCIRKLKYSKVKAAEKPSAALCMTGCEAVDCSKLSKAMDTVQFMQSEYNCVYGKLIKTFDFLIILHSLLME